jgi:Fur family transcriptional regulator, ferric uptake regulator
MAHAKDCRKKKMSCENSTIDTLKNIDHRLTPQRLLLLSAIRHSGEHVTVTQIYDEVKTSYPFIDISTVYRNVNILRELRLISEIHRPDGEHLYEWVGTNIHIHTVCRVCNSMQEINSQYLDSVTEDVLSDFGFKIDADHLAISGICSACQLEPGANSDD